MRSHNGGLSAGHSVYKSVRQDCGFKVELLGKATLLMIGILALSKTWFCILLIL